MWWLVRRPGFDVTKWKAKCRCILCVCVNNVFTCSHTAALPQMQAPPHFTHSRLCPPLPPQRVWLWPVLL